MAKPGPKPKPTALRKLQGNPAKRALPANEPKPPPVKAASAVPPPDHLGPEGKACWARAIDTLTVAGILATTDLDVLSAHCTAWERYVEAEIMIRKTGGAVIKGRQGPVRNPWVMVSHQAMEKLLRTIPELGMSPASRPRLGRVSGAAAVGETHGSAATLDDLDSFLDSRPGAVN